MSRTPGPWALRGVQIRADAGLGQHVATYAVSRADGLLIAAAPDLLRALEVLLSCHPGPIAPYGLLPDAVRMAKEAIKKAEG